jgi:hypothetical protein
MFDGGVGADADLYARVEVFELCEGCFGAGDLADVFVPAVEVASDVFDGDGVRVVDGDLFGSGQDEVLGDLDS